MDLTEYRQRYQNNPHVGPGWDAINQQLERLYPGQEPVHYATRQHAAWGGEFPLDGVSVYASTSGPVPHLHYVSFGMSELYYKEEAFGGEFSRWGFEFTFRLKAPAKSAKKNNWPVQVMQNLGRYVESNDRWFEEFHFLSANGPIRTDRQTAITAIAFVRDPELGVIETPHGRVLFLQIVGLTTAEYEPEESSQGAGIESLLDRLRVGNPLLVTDLDRT